MAIFDACVVISQIFDHSTTIRYFCAYVSARLLEFVDDAAATPTTLRERLRFATEFLSDAKFEEAGVIEVIRSIIVPLSAASDKPELENVVCEFFAEVCLILAPRLPIESLVHDLRDFRIGNAVGLRSVLASIIRYHDDNAETTGALRRLFQKEERDAFRRLVWQTEAGVLGRHECCHACGRTLRTSRCEVCAFPCGLHIFHDCRECLSQTICPICTRPDDERPEPPPRRAAEDGQWEARVGLFERRIGRRAADQPRVRRRAAIDVVTT
jgi:hypothetical protein